MYMHRGGALCFSCRRRVLGRIVVHILFIPPGLDLGVDWLATGSTHLTELQSRTSSH